jgi:hypothetical protein
LIYPGRATRTCSYPQPLSPDLGWTYRGQDIMIMSSSSLCCFPALSLAFTQYYLGHDVHTCLRNFVQAAIMIMCASSYITSCQNYKNKNWTTRPESAVAVNRVSLCLVVSLRNCITHSFYPYLPLISQQRTLFLLHSSTDSKHTTTRHRYTPGGVRGN